MRKNDKELALENRYDSFWDEIYYSSAFSRINLFAKNWFKIVEMHLHGVCHSMTSLQVWWGHTKDFPNAYIWPLKQGNSGHSTIHFVYNLAIAKVNRHSFTIAGMKVDFNVEKEYFKKFFIIEKLFTLYWFIVTHFLSQHFLYENE